MSDERRKSVLTDEDLGKIQGAIHETFAQQFTRWCEAIGYDVTTPESRSAIRDDHRFISIMRKSAVWVVATAVIAIAGAAAAGWVP